MATLPRKIGDVPEQRETKGNNLRHTRSMPN